MRVLLCTSVFRKSDQPVLFEEPVEFLERFGLLPEGEQRFELLQHLFGIEPRPLDKQYAFDIQPVPFATGEGFRVGPSTLEMGEQGVDKSLFGTEPGQQGEICILRIAWFTPSLHGQPADETKPPVSLRAEFLEFACPREDGIHRPRARWKMAYCSTKPEVSEACRRGFSAEKTRRQSGRSPIHPGAPTPRRGRRPEPAPRPSIATSIAFSRQGLQE